MKNRFSAGMTVGATALLAAMAMTGPASAETCSFEPSSYTVKDQGENVGTLRTVHLPAGLYLEGNIYGGTVRYKIGTCYGPGQAEMRKLNGPAEAPASVQIIQGAGNNISLEFDDGGELVQLGLFGQ